VGVRPETVAVAALLEEGAAFFVMIKLFTVAVFVVTTLQASCVLFPETETLALNTVFAGTAPKRFLIVIFFDTGVPFGSSTIISRSGAAVVVNAVSCDIFLSAI
jgi:hypothetical protein